MVVAINRFPTDTPEDLEMIATECSLQGVPCAMVEAFAKGGEGAVDLAHKVVSAIETNPRRRSSRSMRWKMRST